MCQKVKKLTYIVLKCVKMKHEPNRVHNRLKIGSIVTYLYKNVNINLQYG